MNLIYFFLEKLKKSPIILVLWYIRRKQIPPPHIYKQKTVFGYGKKYKINKLYESGTFKGDMVYGMRKKFKDIVSIELSDFFYKLALGRFKKNKHIKIIKGDSEKEIKKYLKNLNEPSVFWLDGHNSFGDTAKGKLNTPIVSELKSILSHKNKSHVILIDDAREFTGKNDYPKINNLKMMLKKSNYSMKIESDIIRITPQN